MATSSFKGNGAVYKDLNLERASRSKSSCHVLNDHAWTLTHNLLTLVVIESS